MDREWWRAKMWGRLKHTLSVSPITDILEFLFLFSVQPLICADNYGNLSHSASKPPSSGLSVTSWPLGALQETSDPWHSVVGVTQGKCLRAMSQGHLTLLSLLFCFHVMAGTRACLPTLWVSPSLRPRSSLLSDLLTALGFLS